MYDPQNVFAKILRGEIPCKKVYEDEFAFAFEDIAPNAPIHVLVAPKGDYISFNDFTANAPSHETVCAIIRMPTAPDSRDIQRTLSAFSSRSA